MFTNASVEAAFLARLAHRRRGQRFTAVDIAAREYPLAIARLDRSTDQDDPPALRLDDRSDSDFRIEIEHEPAARADGALRFRSLQRSTLERSAAPGTEAIRV
jgi:hypothetical protein